MTVDTLGVLNTESFCECVLSCVKLVVSDFHVSLKADEIRMFVILRMNHDFMEYMRVSYPDSPWSEFKVVDTYVHTHGRVDDLDDDEDDEQVFEMKKKITWSERLISLQDWLLIELNKFFCGVWVTVKFPEFFCQSFHYFSFQDFGEEMT